MSWLLGSKMITIASEDASTDILIKKKCQNFHITKHWIHLHMVDKSVSHKCFRPLHLTNISGPCCSSHIPRPFHRFPFHALVREIQDLPGPEREMLPDSTVVHCGSALPTIGNPIKGTTFNHSQITRVHSDFTSHPFIPQGLTYCRKLTRGYHACIYLKTSN